MVLSCQTEAAYSGTARVLSLSGRFSKMQKSNISECPMVQWKFPGICWALPRHVSCVGLTWSCPNQILYIPIHEKHVGLGFKN